MEKPMSALRRHAVITVAVAAAALGALAGVAYAGTAYSSVRNFNVDSRPYSNRALISTGGSYATAYAKVHLEDGGTRQVGHLVSQVSRRNGNTGAIMCTTAWQFNTWVTADHDAGDCATQNAGVYYAKGHSRVWNGSQYIEHETYQSPNQNQY